DRRCGFCAHSVRRDLDAEQQNLTLKIIKIYGLEVVYSESLLHRPVIHVLFSCLELVILSLKLDELYLDSQKLGFIPYVFAGETKIPLLQVKILDLVLMLPRIIPFVDFYIEMNEKERNGV
ncbi:hypothetical protein ACJX0J_020357, partial [Zea mays]